MMKVVKIMSVALLAIVALAASFLAGRHFMADVARYHLDAALSEINASQVYGDLSAHQSILSYLEAGCVEQAITLLRYNIDGQKMSLAERIHRSYDYKLEEYIASRNPELLQELEYYETRYRYGGITLDRCEGRDSPGPADQDSDTGGTPLADSSGDRPRIDNGQ